MSGFYREPTPGRSGAFLHRTYALGDVAGTQPFSSSSSALASFRSAVSEPAVNQL